MPTMAAKHKACREQDEKAPEEQGAETRFFQKASGLSEGDSLYLQPVQVHRPGF